MLTRAGTMALRALVELARQPELQLSGPELARRQGLPQPKLEQVLLQLRQAGLVEARRGRCGGYRLCRNSAQIQLHQVLDAVGGRRVSLLDLPLPSHEGVPPSAAAGDQLERQLLLKLERAIQRELERLTLAELLYDQRSWEASLDPEGGLMLG
jgi:Rrf2 family protein